MGIETFPSCHTYQFAQDKIKQTAAFSLMDIPHPRTKIFYGPRQKQSIPDHFEFPFIAKMPRGSAKGTGVWLIQDRQELAEYTAHPFPAYIQEYLPIQRDLRVIIIGKKIRLAFWRESAPDTFKTNLSQGGRICFDTVPAEASELALETAARCGWNDIGIDLIEHEKRFFCS